METLSPKRDEKYVRKNVLEKLNVVPVFLYVNLKLKEASD